MSLRYRSAANLPSFRRVNANEWPFTNSKEPRRKAGPHVHEDAPLKEHQPNGPSATMTLILLSNSAIVEEPRGEESAYPQETTQPTAPNSLEEVGDYAPAQSEGGED